MLALTTSHTHRPQQQNLGPKPPHFMEKIGEKIGERDRQTNVLDTISWLREKKRILDEEFHQLICQLEAQLPQEVQTRHAEGGRKAQKENVAPAISNPNPNPIFDRFPLSFPPFPSLKLWGEQNLRKVQPRTGIQLQQEVICWNWITHQALLPLSSPLHPSWIPWIRVAWKGGEEGEEKIQLSDKVFEVAAFQDQLVISASPDLNFPVPPFPRVWGEVRFNGERLENSGLFCLVLSPKQALGSLFPMSNTVINNQMIMCARLVKGREKKGDSKDPRQDSSGVEFLMGNGVWQTVNSNKKDKTKVCFSGRPDLACFLLSGRLLSLKGRVLSISGWSQRSSFVPSQVLAVSGKSDTGEKEEDSFVLVSPCEFVSGGSVEFWKFEPKNKGEEEMEFKFVSKWKFNFWGGREENYLRWVFSDRHHGRVFCDLQKGQLLFLSSDDSKKQLWEMRDSQTGASLSRNEVWAKEREWPKKWPETATLQGGVFYVLESNQVCLYSTSGTLLQTLVSSEKCSSFDSPFLLVCQQGDPFRSEKFLCLNRQGLVVAFERRAEDRKDRKDGSVQDEKHRGWIQLASSCSSSSCPRNALLQCWMCRNWVCHLACDPCFHPSPSPPRYRWIGRLDWF